MILPYRYIVEYLVEKIIYEEIFLDAPKTSKEISKDKLIFQAVNIEFVG